MKKLSTITQRMGIYLVDIKTNQYTDTHVLSVMIEKRN